MDNPKHAPAIFASLVPMDLALWARKRNAPFRLADAAAAGFGRDVVRRAVHVGILRRLAHGVYVSEVLWQGTEGRWRHRLEVLGRMAQLGTGWRAARRSSAWLHGLPLLGDGPTAPQLAHDLGEGHVNGKNRHERVVAIPERDHASIWGVPTLGAARTVADISCEEGLCSGLVTADGALRRGMTMAQLLEVAARCAEWPGGLQALRVAKHADGRHETAIESLSWAGCVEVGIEVPEPQVRIFLGDRLIARVDGL